MSDFLLYFAYGSNLWPPRIQARVPSALFIGRGWLKGFRLRFHKLGADGSAKADAHFTGRQDHFVHGVLYRMLVQQRTQLDRFEGGYNRASVIINQAQGEVRAFTYVAAEPVVHPLAPFEWYRELLLAGAEKHGLPSQYRDMLRKVATTPDPNHQRHTENWPR